MDTLCDITCNSQELFWDYVRAILLLRWFPGLFEKKNFCFAFWRSNGPKRRATKCWARSGRWSSRLEPVHQFPIDTKRYASTSVSNVRLTYVKLPILTFGYHVSGAKERRQFTGDHRLKDERCKLRFSASTAWCPKDSVFSSESVCEWWTLCKSLVTSINTAWLT